MPLKKLTQLSDHSPRFNEKYSLYGLDKENCKKILNLVQGRWQESKVEADSSWGEHNAIDATEYVTNDILRTSDIFWTKEQWVVDLLWQYMHHTNVFTGRRWAIDAVETMQITRYREKDFYDFHIDGRGDHHAKYMAVENELMHGKVRKMSMTVLLNDDYEGGEFQFAVCGKGRIEVIPVEEKSTGTIIVFPSTMEHRVTPVTKGTRYSLVAWYLGPPFE